MDARPPTTATHDAAMPVATEAQALRRHWRDTRRLTLALLVPWFVLGFGVSFDARALAFDFFGWPFSFWVAAQGAGLGFLLVLVVYAAVMRRLDRRLAEDLASAAAQARMAGAR